MTVPGHAQTEWKDRYVTLAEENQTNPSIALPAQSDYTVIVWEDTRNGATDIYAQMIENNTGLAVWDPIDGVPVCTEQGVQRNPRAAFDSLGGVIFVWEDFRDRYNSAITDTTVSEIYAHRIVLAYGRLDTNWSQQSDGVPVCSGTQDIARDVCIVGTTDGAYIAWTDYRNSAGYPSYKNRDVFIQYLLTQTGTYPAGWNWVANGINVTMPNPCPAFDDSCDQQHPDIALDFSMRTPLMKYGAIVTYEDDRDDPWQIYADNLGADGSNLWGYDLRVAPTQVQNQYRPCIAGTGFPGDFHNGVVIAWEDARDYYTAQKMDVYGQNVTHLGVRAWNVNGLAICTADETQRRVRVAARYDLAMVVWEDTRDSIVTDIDVYGNAIDIPTGTPEWPATSTGLLSQANYAQCKPEVDIRDDEIVIAWEDWRDFLKDEEGEVVLSSNIYGHSLAVIDPSLYRWPGNGQPVTLAKHDQLQPQVAGNVIVYQDGRRQPVVMNQIDQRIDENIYAQQFGNECDLPTEMHWKEEFVKWTWGTDMQQHRFVVDSLGNTYAVWIEMRPDLGGEECVFVQKLDRDGVPKWYNDGVQVNAPGDPCMEPDICVDGAEGAFVTWQQNGGNIHLAHLDYLGVVTGEVIDIDQGNGPRIVEDDAGGVLLGFNDPYVGIQLRHYDVGLNQLATRTYAAPAAPYLGVKLSKDRNGGTWFVWHDGTDYFGNLWDGANAPLIHGSLSSQYNSPFFSITGEIDIDTDYLPYYDLVWHRYGKYDGLVTAVVNVIAGGQDDILVARLLQPTAGTVSFGGLFDMSKNGVRLLPFGRYNISSVPAIAADSLAADFSASPVKQLGGAILTWTSEYTDPISGTQKYYVLTERIYWDPVGAPNYYNGNVHFGRNLEVLLDFNLSAKPIPDIATVFNPDQEYFPGVPRYGVVTWNSVRSAGCTHPIAVRVQHVDYSISNMPPNEPRRWGSFGRDVAPLTGITEQTAPFVKTPWPLSAVSQPNSIPVYWADTRSGSPCLLATRVYDDNQTLVWNKEVARDREEHIPVSLQLGMPYPNPASLMRHNSVQLPVESVTMGTAHISLFDALGRRIAASREVQLSAGSSVLSVDLSAFGNLRPGVYFFGVETADGVSTRQLILLR